MIMFLSQFNLSIYLFLHLQSFSLYLPAISRVTLPSLCHKSSVARELYSFIRHTKIFISYQPPPSLLYFPIYLIIFTVFALSSLPYFLPQLCHESLLSETILFPILLYFLLYSISILFHSISYSISIFTKTFASMF